MDRSSTITFRGKEYELVLSNEALCSLAEKYGGIENLGSKLMEGKSLSDIIYIVVLLANQSILQYNFDHKDKPKELLTEEEFKLFSAPYELNAYGEAAGKAIEIGMKQYIQSEDNHSKNVAVG